MDSTIGVSMFLGQPATDDCVLVKVLKHCGAVPFVKTNLPQLMQWLVLLVLVRYLTFGVYAMIGWY